MPVIKAITWIRAWIRYANSYILIQICDWSKSDAWVVECTHAICCEECEVTTYANLKMSLEPPSFHPALPPLARPWLTPLGQTEEVRTLIRELQLWNVTDACFILVLLRWTWILYIQHEERMQHGYMYLWSMTFTWCAVWRYGLCLRRAFSRYWCTCEQNLIEESIRFVVVRDL